MSDYQLRAQCLIAASLALMAMASLAMASLSVAMWFWIAWR